MSSGDSVNPPPGAVNPLKVGTLFIKQYYQCLVTSPVDLHKFYMADSTVSRGMEPTAPTTPVSLLAVLDKQVENGEDLSSGERMRRSFFDWADSGDEHLRLDLTRGAIDAQESQGGILIVVTGHMYLPQRLKEKAFVHTFFLFNDAPPGQRKTFRVKNDILRFLEPVSEALEKVQEEEIVEGVLKNVLGANEMAQTPSEKALTIVEERKNVTVLDVVVETEPTIEPVEFEPSADEEKIPDSEDEEEEEPAAVEEAVVALMDPVVEERTTESMPVVAEPDSPGSSPSCDSKKKHRKRWGGKSRSRSTSPEEGNASSGKPKTPGSWASLVANNKGTPNSESKGKARRSSKDKHNSKAPPQAILKDELLPEYSATTTTSVKNPPNNNTGNRTIDSKRRPEATLFIRNIPDKTTQHQILSIFEPHGLKTGNKILGINLNSNRGFCFVDFDGPAAVESIIKQAKDSAIVNEQGRKIRSDFMVGNRVLEIERKVPKDKSSNHSGGSNKERRSYNNHRSNSPKDGGGSGSGRYRRSRSGSRRSPARERK